MIELIHGLTPMLLVKTGIAVSMVILLSVLAEVVSPRFAGIFSGYPLGAAITLFFIGIEASPEFAAKSALYTCLGLVATQVFAYTYFRTSVALRNPSRFLEIAAASFAGICGYFAAAALLRLMPASIVAAVLLPVFSILVFGYLFRGVKNVRIANRVSLKPEVLLFRAVFAAFAVILITSTARLVGPGWAGLFSAFPITMLPFVGIVHFTYGPECARAVLKNVPRGLISLLAYSIAVSLFYEPYGVYAGTAIAYGFATIFLIVAQLKSSPS